MLNIADIYLYLFHFRSTDRQLFVPNILKKMTTDHGHQLENASSLRLYRQCLTGEVQNQQDGQEGGSC